MHSTVMDLLSRIKDIIKLFNGTMFGDNHLIVKAIDQC